MMADDKMMADDNKMPDLGKRIRELSVFHEVGKALTSTLDLSQVLQTIMEKISGFFRPDTWSLLLVDEKTGELHFEIAIGAGAESLRDVRLKPGEGIAGWVVQHGEPLIVPNVGQDERFASHLDGLTKVETNSVVCVPVRGRDRILGVIELINYVAELKLDEDDLFRLQALADYAAIAIENARYVQRIQELTITDDCTKLYNSRYLHAVLDAEVYRSSRYQYEFSVIFIDLDYFKKVNDVHGHLVGSKLLAQLGQVIKGRLRLIDFAFRYGGDEFVVLLPQTPKQSAINVARRIHQLIGRHTFLSDEGLNLKVTASLGVACFPDDAQTKEQIIRLADEAMYLVKKNERNSIAVANQGMLV